MVKVLDKGSAFDSSAKEILISCQIRVKSRLDPLSKTFTIAAFFDISSYYSSIWIIPVCGLSQS
jgi:hypothetical protein